MPKLNRWGRPKSVKVQMYFRPDLIALMDSLMEKTGAMSRAEVMRTAVKEYARLVIDRETNTNAKSGA